MPAKREGTCFLKITRHLCFPNYVIEIRKEKTQSAMVRYSSIKCSCRMVRYGVGHGETCFLGTVKNPELGMLEIMIWFWSKVPRFGNESMSAVAELPGRMQRAPFHREEGS